MGSENPPTTTITYTQAFDETKAVEEPADFSMKTAYEMLVQAKMAIERAYGNSMTGTYDCALSNGDQTNTFSGEDPSPPPVLPSDEDPFTPPPLDGETPSEPTDLPSSAAEPPTHNTTRWLQDDDEWTISADGVRQCEGGVSSLFMMNEFFRQDNFTAKQFVVDAAVSMGLTIIGLAFDQTVITLEKSELAPQIEMETMQIELALELSGDFFFQAIQTSFCGSNGCAYLDVFGPNSYPVQPEIGVTPYVTDCSLGRDQIHYSADLRAFYPDNCSRVNNSAFLYGYGSYITGDEYGSSAPGWKGAYIKSLRRRIVLTFAKVTWTTEDLAQTFNASCGEGSDQNINCTGLWYQLQPSGRFLFAGDDALPSDRLAKTNYRSPIPLVQLNSPIVDANILRQAGLVRLESLVPRNFQTVMWQGKPVYNGSALGGDQCSVLVDSYLKHVNENNYFIERPMQAMYTSFFYFLMGNAAVTKLNDTSAALNGINTSATALFKDRLGNVKLTGDIQVRRIRVAIPIDSFYATLFGCVCIFFATAVILVARREEPICEHESKAEQFVAFGRDADYPNNVHNKLLGLIDNGSVWFNAVRIESLVLVPKEPTPKTAADVGSSRYSRVSQLEPRDIQEELSEGTSSEELP